MNRISDYEATGGRITSWLTEYLDQSGMDVCDWCQWWY